MNLARNAAEQTSDGDEIGLGSAMTDGHVRIWVRDRGPGIAAADHARVFDRHVRLGDTAGRGEGAGLGLAIVQAVARAHRGRVELVSQRGSGATFTLVVPAEPETAEP
jgi:signal transduction histidine kinase